MDRSAGGLDIRSAGSFSVEGGLVEGGIILDPPALGKQSAARRRPWTRSVPAAVGAGRSSLAVLRWVNLPAREGDELRAAAKFKAKRHLPFSVDAAYGEASPIELSEDGMTGSSLVT